MPTSDDGFYGQAGIGVRLLFKYWRLSHGVTRVTVFILKLKANKLRSASKNLKRADSENVHFYVKGTFVGYLF